MEDELLQGLAAGDVPLIDGARGDGGAPVPRVKLIEGHVLSRNPRFALCVIPLLLRHPSRAGEAVELARTMEGPGRRELRILCTAAAACQRLYRSRLRWAGAEGDVIADCFCAELGLPPAGELHGRLCLTAMDDLPSSWDGRDYRRAEAYRRIVELFLRHRESRAATR